jgi:hypothetical protein
MSRGDERQDPVGRKFSFTSESDNMKKTTFIIYTSYIWTKMLLGLTFHPYKSVKETIKRPILLPVIFSPILAILLLFLTAKIGSLLIIVYGLKREAVALFLSTTFISILFWQALLLYLLINFMVASWKKN